MPAWRCGIQGQVLTPRKSQKYCVRHAWYCDVLQVILNREDTGLEDLYAVSQVAPITLLLAVRTARERVSGPGARETCRPKWCSHCSIGPLTPFHQPSHVSDVALATAGLSSISTSCSQQRRHSTRSSPRTLPHANSAYSPCRWPHAHDPYANPPNTDRGVVLPIPVQIAGKTLNILSCHKHQSLSFEKARARFCLLHSAAQLQNAAVHRRDGLPHRADTGPA